MNLKEFLAACQERLSKMYSVRFTNTGKNKIYFTINDDEFLVTKDKSWSPGLVKTIVEDGHMFPCVLEIRDDPPEYTERDVEKLVNHIDEYFVKEAGLGKSWAICNRLYYLEPLLSKLVSDNVSELISYGASNLEDPDSDIELRMIGKNKKDLIVFSLGTTSFEITLSGEMSEKIIRADYRHEDNNLLFEYLKKKYGELRLL